MKDESTIDEPDELAEGRVAEHRAGEEGIEVGELIDIESIELHSKQYSAVENLGWETVQPGDDLKALFAEDEDHQWQPGELSDEARSQLAELEDEHLHLAAELADLRRAAAERESSLQAQLEKTRALLRERDGELSDQEAQIASLTLECEGLRAQLSDQDYREPLELAGTGSFDAANAGSGKRSVVVSLKQRLIESGHALTVAREETEKLKRERAELAAALAARGSQMAKLLARLTRSTTRLHLQDEIKTGLGRLLGKSAGVELDEAGVLPPGSDEPTIANDEPPESKAAPKETVEAALPAKTPRQPRAGERRLRTAASGQRRRRTDAGVRRYLIALDPTHEEVCELAERRMYVGRGVEADVRVSDATASRLHALLYLERGSTVVEDACSTNGVFVNTQRVRRAVLVDGDTVAFGNVRFQYRVGPATASMD